MRISRQRIAVFALCWLLAAAPGQAWEFGQVGEQVFFAGSRDIAGDTQLVFFCSQASPGIVQLQLFTTERPPSDAVAVELSITTSTDTFGPIAARATDQGGNLTVATTGMDLAAMNAAQSVYAEDGQVTVQYYESVWRYPGADHAEAFGAMLDACG